MKFTGEYADPTGLYHLRARYVDPAIGRFLQLDPAPGSQADASLAEYLYAANRPTVMVDPTGETFIASDAGQDAAEGSTAPDDSSSRALLFVSRTASSLRLTPSQLKNARIVFRLASHARLARKRAREMVAAAYMESSLNARAVNSSSGAAGLFQLLSSGYVRSANALGGVFNPRANTCAILPSYAAYWQQHPLARPGIAAAVVEASGESAAFYARPLSWLPQTFDAIAVAPCPA